MDNARLILLSAWRLSILYLAKMPKNTPVRRSRDYELPFPSQSRPSRCSDSHLEQAIHSQRGRLLSDAW